jgi:hypothetical protein
MDRLVALLALVVLGGIVGTSAAILGPGGPAASSPGGSGAAVTSTSPTAPSSAGASTGPGEELGVDVTTFMQASAVRTATAVETGTWTAAFERANQSRKAAVLDRRVGRLRARLDRLEARKPAVFGADGDSLAGRTRVVALALRIDALHSAIVETSTVAAGAGVDTAALEPLRARAAALTGPQVAAVLSEVEGEPVAPGSNRTDTPAAAVADRTTDSGDTGGSTTGTDDAGDSAPTDGADGTVTATDADGTAPADGARGTTADIASTAVHRS